MTFEVEHSQVTEYNKIIQKLDTILYNDNLNDFEKKLQIVNEIINPLYDKAFDLILEKEKLENEKLKKENEKLKKRKEKLEKEVSDAGWREEAARERAWIERGDDGMDWMRMP